MTQNPICIQGYSSSAKVFEDNLYILELLADQEELKTFFSPLKYIEIYLKNEDLGNIFLLNFF